MGFEIIVKFENDHEASKWEWLFVRILRMRICCAGAYDNAYTWD